MLRYIKEQDFAKPVDDEYSDNAKNAADDEYLDKAEEAGLLDQAKDIQELEQYLLADEADAKAADDADLQSELDQYLLDGAQELHELDHLESYGIGIGMCLMGSRTNS